MWYLRPKPKRYPLAPPRKKLAPQRGNLRPLAPGQKVKLDSCHNCPTAASSDSKSPGQPAPDTQALLANSSSTVPSESSAVASSPGALIDAFFKTTDAAAKRVYMECCVRASLCSLPSYAILQFCCPRPPLRFSSGRPPMRCTLLGGTLVPADTCPASTLQASSFPVQRRAPVQDQHLMHASSLRHGPQNTSLCQMSVQHCHSHAPSLL